MRVLVERPDLLAAQTLEQSIAFEPAAAQVAEPAVGGHPQAAVAIQQQHPYAAVCQPILRAEILKRAAVPARQAAVGADPDAALAVFAKRAREVVHQSLLHAVAVGAGALPATLPASYALPIGANPQAAGTIAEHVADGQRAESGGQRGRRQRLARYLKQAAVEGRHEQRSTGILVDGVDALRYAIGRGDGAGGAGAQAQQAALRAHPHVVF